MITSNLENFGGKNLEEAIKLLEEMRNGCLPISFELDLIKLRLDDKLGHVYLENQQKQKIMMNFIDAEIYYECSKCQKAGFLDDFLSSTGSIVSDLKGCCIKYLKDLAVIDFDGKTYTKLGS